MKKIVFTLGMLALVFLVQGQVKMSDLEFRSTCEHSCEHEDHSHKEVYATFVSNNKPADGRIRILSEDTTEYVDAIFSNGYATGKWKYYKDGKWYTTMPYKNGLLHGKTIIYHADCKTIKEKATVKNGLVNGKMRIYSEKGTLVYEKKFKKGVAEGMERRYSEDGEVIYECSFKNGKAEGKCFQQMKVGSSDTYMVLRHYKNGIHTGEYLETYKNGGIKTKGYFSDNQREGLWEYFNPDGSRKSIAETYQNGKVIKRINYFANGKIESERNFNTNGKLHGIEKKYAYEGGDLISEKRYENGIPVTP